MLTAQDYRGVYGILPTPAKDGANRWDATDTVDLEETARLAEKLIADGCKGLLALGTTGECATLTEAEFNAFADCLLSTVNQRVPTLVGATTLGTHETVRRLRFLRERGADGTMLGLPMWQPCSEDQAVKFYASISEAFPDMAIMVYANQHAFRFNFPPSFWAGVAAMAPTATSAKFANPASYLDCMVASENKINFLPIDSMALAFAQQSPDTVTALWATAACMGPQPCVALMDAIDAKDFDRAAEITKEIAWANETLVPGSIEEFGKFNLQLEKIRFNEAGYCNAGPIRPPYDVVPAEYAEGARECGRRWAQIAKRYPSVGAER